MLVNLFKRRTRSCHACDGPHYKSHYPTFFGRTFEVKQKISGFPFLVHSFTQQYLYTVTQQSSSALIRSCACLGIYLPGLSNTVRPPPLKPPTSTALTIHSTEMKVTLNGTVLAESDNTIVVENNHYFPPNSVKSSLFTDSNTRWASKMWYMRLIRLKCLLSSTICPWKG